MEVFFEDKTLHRAVSSAVLPNVASSTRVSLHGASNEANAKLEKDFRANSALTVNDVDLEAFRKQTAQVFDKWEQKPFGAFVRELRKAVLG